ncbi:glycosyl transferase [Halobacteriales archaeon QS_4_69_34]|nr:MAG: glycosyl transferase [Halobacteriales archaeon QS_4_69_34]
MPTLNEEEGIGECITQIKNALVELDVTGEIIISDSSVDRTPEIAAEAGAFVVEPDGSGYGYAYRYAFERARGEYIAIGDADTTYDFEELPKLFRPISRNGTDMVLGSRFGGEIAPGAMPALHQYVGNPVLTRFLNTFYGTDVTDAHSGFRVLHRETVEQLELASDGMEFASEMIMQASARGLTIEETPITYHEREGDATLDSFRDGWRHVRFMLVNAPGYLFSVPGMVLGAFGMLIMTLAFFDIGVGGQSLGVHSMVAGSLLTIVGYQVVTLGVFATVASDPIKRAEDPVSAWMGRHLRLEQGGAAGVLVFVGGAVYAASLLGQWITSGFDELPFLMSDIVAATAIVLGLQIVFSAFFMSTVAERK